jgi:Flp pilus assembly protein TadD
MLYTFVYSFVADHYQYVACLGPIALAAAGIERGLGRMAKATPLLQPVCCGGLLILLGALTWHQCGMYADTKTLWSITLSRNPASWMARNNLGSDFLAKGDRKEAIAQFQKALTIKPDFAEALNNLGKALFAKGDREEAIAQFQKALTIKPDFAEALNNLGYALLAKGDREEAIAQFQKALAIHPDFAMARNNLGKALLAKGAVDEAIAQFRKALEYDPVFAQARGNLGHALLAKGDLKDAIAQFRKALELAEAQTNGAMAEALRKEIQLYEANTPLRDLPR